MEIVSIIGTIKISIGVIMLAVVFHWGRKYEKHPYNPKSRRYTYMGKKGHEHYWITPEQKLNALGTILIIEGSIIQIL